MRDVTTPPSQVYICAAVAIDHAPTGAHSPSLSLPLSPSSLPLPPSSSSSLPPPSFLPLPPPATTESGEEVAPAPPSPKTSKKKEGILDLKGYEEDTIKGGYVLSQDGRRWNRLWYQLKQDFCLYKFRAHEVYRVYDCGNSLQHMSTPTT